MKHKLTYTDNYILVVDDSEIKVGDVITDKYNVWTWKDDSSLLGRKKIIAHLPLNNSTILEGVPLLPPIFIENGKDEFIEYIKQKHNQERCVGFMDGWNKHAEKYKYTEEDMKYMFECGRNYQNNAEITFKIAMEYLSQPKAPTHFECETSYLDKFGNVRQPKGYIKTTINSQGQTVWVGNYIQEL